MIKYLEDDYHHSYPYVIESFSKRKKKDSAKKCTKQDEIRQKRRIRNKQRDEYFNSDKQF